MGTGALAGNGTLVSTAIVNPAPGTHVYTAAYAGDTTYPAFAFGSLTVTVAAGPASQLAFSTPPLATLSAAAARGNVVVAIEDAAGDVTASGAQVTLAVSGPNAYSQTHTAAAINGMALFAFNSALLSAGTGWLHHCTSFPL